jgi:hypothetical protein
MTRGEMSIVRPTLKTFDKGAVELADNGTTFIDLWNTARILG